MQHFGSYYESHWRLYRDASEQLAMTEGPRREAVPEMVGFADEDDRVWKQELLMIPHLLGNLPTEAHRIPKEMSIFGIIKWIEARTHIHSRRLYPGFKAGRPNLRQRESPL